jgi:restriction endonuclease Mrr
VLIECKDFDISGDKIGLDIIRNFRSVLEDTKADEGVVVTCNGFTTDAQKYAAKGVKLLVLRAFERADMVGRIKTVGRKASIALEELGLSYTVVRSRC